MLTLDDKTRSEYRNVWVVGEQRAGDRNRVTFELLGAGRRLADSRGAELWCVLLGAGVTVLADACFAAGADGVIVVDDPALDRQVDDLHADTLVRLVRKYRPEVVLCGATTYGRAVIPRVAVQCDAGLTADCTGLDIDPATGNLLQTRPAFGGNIFATIRCASHRPQMATVRPRVMSEPAMQPGRGGRLVIEPLQADAAAARRRMRVIEVFCNTAETVKLADAEFIVTGGRGLGGRSGFDLLRDFAGQVDGAVGASRAAVDAGWIDYAHQVGQTGQTVQPKVYFACGVSGQIQHLVGMQSSGVVIAIDKNPSTPMMQFADYAIVGDLFEILPAVLRELRNA